MAGRVQVPSLLILYPALHSTHPYSVVYLQLAMGLICTAGTHDPWKNENVELQARQARF